MKVAIVNKAGAASGGAGRMASNLRSWLEDAGHSAELLVAEPTGEPHARHVRTRTTQLLKNIEVRSLMNEVLPLGYPDLRRALRRIDPDVVHVHDISRAFSVDTIRLVAKHRPVVWTLHDQSAMTGGCISPHPCTRFEQGCGQCPKFGSWTLQGRRDLTGYSHSRRAAFHDDSRVVIATPSAWAANRFLRSPAFSDRHEIRVVPNAIRPAEISHVTRSAARRKLGVPADRFVVVIISHDLHDTAKNPESQRVAIRSLADLDPLVLSMGNSSIAFERSLLPVEVRGLGFIADGRIRRLTYTAADVFVNASLSDTFSLTTLESLAVGTPVVAYASGGIPEIITPDCGILVPPDDAAGLAAAVRRIEALDFPERWSTAARQRARSFSPDAHVAAYLDLYDEAIGKFAAR